MTIIEYLNHLIGITSGKQKEYFEILRSRGTLFTKCVTLWEKTPFTVNAKECYKNSILMAYAANIAYYEGYYITELGFPLEHAFNYDGTTGYCTDVTSSKMEFKVTEWFGMEVPKPVLEEYLKTDQIQTALQFYMTEYLLEK